MRRVIPILVGVGVLVGAAVAVYACWPRGEEADWERLVEALERKRSVIQGWGHWEFPDDDQKKAGVQVEAIRGFARKYPKSQYVTRIIVDYLFPNLWRDVEKSGVSVWEGNPVRVSFLAWELHQLAPEMRPGFKEALEEELGRLPKAGWALKWLGEELGDEEMVKRGLARHHADDDESLLERRRAALQELAGVKDEAQVAMRTLLKTFKGADDRILIEVEGHEPDKGTHSRLATELWDNLNRQAGVHTITPDRREEEPVRAVLRVTLSSEVKQLPVVVHYTPSTTTTTVRGSERRWSHGTQDWRSVTVERTVTTERGGGVEGDTYPVYTAEVSLEPPDGEPTWTGKVTSDWVWTHNWREGRWEGWPIEEGSEVPTSSTDDYSVENLANRISYTLLGPAYKRGTQ